MKILAFAASSSRKSINKALVTYAANLLQDSIVEDAEVEIIDINDFEMPIYSVDREEEGGIPQEAHQFFNKIGDADALVIAYAEHNGFYTAAYKNLFDWTSRINREVYQGKPMVILASSPGPGGAGNVLATAKSSAPFYAADIKGDLSVPNFYKNFDVDNGRITNQEVDTKLKTVLASLN